MKKNALLLNSMYLAGSAFLIVAGLLLLFLMPTPASAYYATNNPLLYQQVEAQLVSGTTYCISNSDYDLIRSFGAYPGSGAYEYGNSDSTPLFSEAGSDGIGGNGMDCAGGYNFDMSGLSDGTASIMTCTENNSGNGAGWPTYTGDVKCVYALFTITSGTPAPVGLSSCTDGIENGDETGIDIGGSCAVVNINTPVDTGTTNEFSNWSVSYSGIDVPMGFHKIEVHWSDSSTLLATCVNDPLGSLYGGTWADSEGYSVCTNSSPKVFYDVNSISFSAGITSYTGTVPKSQPLVDGKTYYAQAIITDNSGFNVYKSDVISFTMSGGVPVVVGTGTISNAGGGTVITGTGTHFTNQLKVGDTITFPDGQSAVITSISSDTSMTTTPITSAHTDSSWTSNSGGSVGIEYDECSTFDIACGLRNVFRWFFSVSPSTLNQFSNLTLQNKTPFSYLYDVGTIFNELFANSGSMSYAVSASTPIGTINFISASAISAVPYASTIKTILGYMLYFFTAMTIYRLLLRVHNK